MRDNRLGLCWLRSVPLLFFAVKTWRKRGAKLEVLRPLLQLLLPGQIAEANQPDHFFGKMTFSALITSCTQLFSLIGSRVMISEPAATTMAKMARVSGLMLSIVLWLCFQLSYALFNATEAGKGFLVTFLHIDVQHLQL